MRRRSPILAACLALSLAACGKDAIPPSVNVTGRWIGQVDSTTGPPSHDSNFGTYQLTLDLAQDGAAVTGTFLTSISLSGTVAGAVADRTVRLVMQFAPCGGPVLPSGTENLEGTVDFAGNSMPVLYQGVACGAPDYVQGTLARQ
jgi:hypothetical protein